MKTVYDHIAANNFKTFLLLLLFPLTLWVLTTAAVVVAFYLMGDAKLAASTIAPYRDFLLNHDIAVTPGNIYLLAGIFFIVGYLPFILGLGITWMAVSYFMGDAMMLGSVYARPLEKKDNPQVYRAVENVAIAAGLPMPQVFIINDESLNAFATGRDPTHAAIALTSGIIKKLEPLELEGVIAHEMAHIGNRDIRLNMLIITGLGIFSLMADILRRSLFHHSSGSNRNQAQAKILLFAVMLALMVFNFVVAPLIRMAVSRSREYAADASGALITRNPKALASALQKIAGDARVEVFDKQNTLATACIADPRDTGSAFAGMLQTHPPVSIRIRRLLEMAGEEVRPAGR